MKPIDTDDPDFWIFAMLLGVTTFGFLTGAIIEGRTCRDTVTPAPHYRTVVCDKGATASIQGDFVLCICPRSEVVE